MRTLGLNLLLALIWLGASRGRSLPDFLVGFAAGWTVLSVVGVLLGRRDYPRRCLGLAWFALIFASEFLAANLSVARIVLFRRKGTLRPGFLDYDVAGLRPREIVLLAYCITLTPGTTAVRVSDDFRTLVVHALDADAPETIRRRIDRRLRAPLLRFTR